jgi:hypothetical protein
LLPHAIPSASDDTTAMAVINDSFIFSSSVSIENL